MSTVQKPLHNPTLFDIVQLEKEIEWTQNKMTEVRKEMERRPSKIKHLNDLQRQLNHRQDVLNFYRTKFN